MKKLFVCLLILSLTFGASSYVSAKDNSIYQNESKYATLFLQNLGFGKVQLSNPVSLKNVDGNMEAVVFTLNNKGYLIIDTNDYDIPEFSFDTKNPYTVQDGKNIYNGPYNYMRDNGQNVIDITSNKVTSKSNIEKCYKRSAVDNKTKLTKIKNAEQSQLRSKTNTTYASNPYYSSGNISGTLRTWSTSNYCGVDGCAILLQYYDDYYSDKFVPNNKETASGLTSYLINNKYILNDRTTGSNLINGVSGTTGLNDYLRDQGITNWSAATGGYSWSSLMNQINMNRPLLVGANSSHPDFGAHWIIAHGYLQGYDGVPYIICNNGFGKNNVYTTASSQYYSWGFVFLY